MNPIDKVIEDLKNKLKSYHSYLTAAALIEPKDTEGSNYYRVHGIPTKNLMDLVKDDMVIPVGYSRDSVKKTLASILKHLETADVYYARRLRIINNLTSGDVFDQVYLADSSFIYPSVLEYLQEKFDESRIESSTSNKQA